MTRYNLYYTLEWLYSHSSRWDLALAFFGLFIVSCIREKITNKGPMIWPIFGITLYAPLAIRDPHGFITRALAKAGGTFYYRGVWFGGAHGVMTADPANIEYMVKTNFQNFPKGKFYRERFWDLLGDGIFNADGELWEEQRRKAKTEMHSSRFIRHSFRTMRDLVHLKLLKVTENMARSGDSFDLQEILLWFTFDNICAAAFGVDLGCLNVDLPQVPFAKAFEEATELTLRRFMIPPLVWKPLKLFGLGHERRLKNAIQIIHEFADETVKNRRENLLNLGSINDNSDLLSRLMYMEFTQNGKNITSYDKYFRDFCVSFILAGRDTTSVALAWFFWLVNNNPNIEHNILTELNDILGNPKKHENVFFGDDQLKNMVYLQAALSESLRLYPSVPTEIKEVVKDDILPDGSVLKRGARVYYCILSMGRMVSVWGEDCLEFRPERWIKDGKFVSENQYKYAVFNGGPRLCLGKNFAYMQMKMVAASILLRYKVKVVKGHVVVPKMTTTLYMKNGLLVTLEPR